MLTLSSMAPSAVSPSSHVRFSLAARASKRRRRKKARSVSRQQPAIELAMVMISMVDTGPCSAPEDRPDNPDEPGSPGDGATGDGGGGATTTCTPFSSSTG